MLKDILEFKHADRKWHLPFVAALCVGLPLFIGYYLENFNGGKLASMGGLAILYISSNNLANRMMLLMTCSFGLIMAFSLGLLFSFNAIVGALFLGLFTFGLHFSLYHLGLVRPPGNFFFVMLCAMGLSMPHNTELLPERIGFMAMGVLFSCLLGLVYSLLTLKNYYLQDSPVLKQKKLRQHILESVTYGLFIGTAMLLAHILDLENPYWVPTSCAAVMQGASSRHIVLRSVQRIGGTILGVCIAWMLLHVSTSVLVMCIEITLLQFIVEYLVVRNYGLAVVFISVLALFLGESGRDIDLSSNAVFFSRLFDILLGSIVGVLGGWVLYNQRLHVKALRRIRKARRRGLSV